MTSVNIQILNSLLLIISLSYVTPHGPHHEYGEFTSTEDSECFAKDLKDPIRESEEGEASLWTSPMCECDEGLFRHDNLNRCVSPANGSCTLRSRDGLPIVTCTEYAMCWSMDPVDPTLSRQNGYCYCEPDSRADPHTGLCKLKHGSNRCSKLTDCDVASLVTCRYSSCQCHDEQYQIYDRDSERCEALVGGTCDVSDPPFPAPVCHGENIKCENNICVCEDGYTQTYDKKCSKLTKTTHICQAGTYHHHNIYASAARFSADSAAVESDAVSRDVEGYTVGYDSDTTEAPIVT